ncbi:MAG: iron ABC transporter substrate-binding protein [Chloroflexi bacterium]|nr:iron ABC transporter substrate-binding protein [Chloroflexota bacterium]
MRVHLNPSALFRRGFSYPIVLLASLVLLLAGCSSATSSSLTIYSGRSAELVDPIIRQFSEASGIEVRVKYADTAQLAATLLEEGGKSPADLFFAQDPGGLGAVSHLLAPLPDKIVDQVPTWARSREGKWVGLSGRARVVVYNTDKLREEELPNDIFDFVHPKWKGRIGWAPTNSSFQTMVTAMRLLWGEEKTRQWLLGIQGNSPRVYPNNTSIVAAVGAGEIDVGFPNHYYLYRFLTEKGDSFPARNYNPRSGGPGALVMVAGAGILSTSKNREAAEKFLEFMLSKVAQQYFASQTFEYPFIDGVKSHPLLPSLAGIKNPTIDMADLKDLDGSQKLLRETGVLP